MYMPRALFQNTISVIPKIEFSIPISCAEIMFSNRTLHTYVFKGPQQQGSSGGQIIGLFRLT